MDNIDNMIVSTEKFFIFLSMSKLSMSEQELTIRIYTLDSKSKIFRYGARKRA
jgi:hypothetical protein